MVLKLFGGPAMPSATQNFHLTQKRKCIRRFARPHTRKGDPTVCENLFPSGMVRAHGGKNGLAGHLRAQ